MTINLNPDHSTDVDLTKLAARAAELGITLKNISETDDED